MLEQEVKSKVSEKQSKKCKGIKLFPIILAVFLVLVFGGFLLYTGNYYHATKEVDASLTDFDLGKVINKKDVVIYEPEKTDVGFIFYPGAKVEFTAYAPLLKALAEKNILTVLIKMPFNLAIFNSDAADNYIEQYSEIKTWYIGGHSLGGAMAAKYISENNEKFVGLVLLAAYSTSDFSDTHIKVLSIYGSHDSVLNRTKLIKNAGNLPSSTDVVTIEGGCHSYFGYYGMQKGDGIPFITREEQIKETVSSIVSFIQQ